MNKINDISHVLFFILFDINKAKYITLTFILLLLNFALLFNSQQSTEIKWLGSDVWVIKSSDS